MNGIRVEGITKAFGKKVAVANVSFDVPEGSFSTLLGPSGCGKSTTLRLIAGLERPDAGSIWVRGDLVNAPDRRMSADKRNIGFVFQAYALWPHMTAYDQVAYPLRVRGVPKARVSELVAKTLDTVGLSLETTRYPSELSGGQQQRVALARALVFNPDVLLLDEPLSNLDAELRAQMRAELYSLQKRIKVTTVYVTHDQLEALSLSDVVVVMDEGAVVEVGSPRQIYERPGHRVTAAFVGGAAMIEGNIVRTEGGQAELQVNDMVAIAGACIDPLKIGDSGVLAIKPEDLIIGSPVDVAGKNQVAATVISSMYFGAHVLVELRVNTTTIRAQVPRSRVVAPGDEVCVTFPADRVFIFAARGAVARLSASAPLMPGASEARDGPERPA